MAAFTFYGTFLKGFRAGFDPQQGSVVSPCATPACVFVLRRAHEMTDVLGSAEQDFREGAPCNQRLTHHHAFAVRLVHVGTELLVWRGGHNDLVLVFRLTFCRLAQFDKLHDLAIAEGTYRLCADAHQNGKHAGAVLT